MAKQYFDPSDIGENRFLGGLGYLIFFVPLIACPKSKYGRYCANQGLLALLTFVVVVVAFGILSGILGWIPLVGWLIALIGNLAEFAIVMVMIYHAYLACARGDAHELPVVGSFTLIK